ncbi:hypothetical protein Tco_1152815 [Tanacetum coccineum]
MSMMGEMKFFFGLQVHQSPYGIFISQSQYTLELLKKHGMDGCDTINTPMATAKLDADLQGTPTDQTKYRSMIGGLMYLTASRSDIAFTTFTIEGAMTIVKDIWGHTISGIKIEYQYADLFTKALPKKGLSISSQNWRSIRTSSISFYLPRNKVNNGRNVIQIIEEGKQEHEEMRAFICEFRTTNEILFKERNNSLSELRFEVQELLKVINNTPMTNFEIKGVTTRGRKSTTHDVQNNSTNIHAEEPLMVEKRKRRSSAKKVLRKPEATPHQFAFHRSPSSNAEIRQISERQSITRPPADDDECYGIDDLDETINDEAQELLANDKSDSFLLKGMEKSINQSDLESCECFKFESEHLYSASANEIDDKKPELKSLPHHLQYAYLHGDKSFPIIISSILSEKEKMLLLQVLEKRKGAIAWKMSNIKGISPSYCHKILIEDDFKPVIQPRRRLNPKVQDVVKNEIVKLLDSGLIYAISNSSWVSPIHVVPKKEE